MRARRTRPTQGTAARRQAAHGGWPQRRSPLLTMLVAAMALAGCADAGSPGADVTPGGTDGVTDETVESTLPLLQIERSGGFVLAGTDFGHVPELTVYADGEAITHGPQIAIYPPPTLPNLLHHDLSDADVDALVTAARDAGLLEEVPDYGRPPVADAPTTYVTLRVDGQEYVHSAEALGMGDSGPAEPSTADDAGTEGTEGTVPAEELPGDEPLPGLTDDERAARAELSAFVTRAHELVGSAGEGESYPLDAFAVMARPAPDDAMPEPAEPAEPADRAVPDDSAGTMPAPDDGLQRQVFPWPLDLSLADAEDCVLVDGEQAVTLREVLADASFTTQFDQDGVRYDVWFRPLLPHEEGCDDV